MGTPALVSPAVGAGHWLDGHGALVLDPPAKGLAEIFRAAHPPTVSCSIPAALTPTEIGRQQVRIYEEAIRGD